MFVKAEGKEMNVPEKFLSSGGRGKVRRFAQLIPVGVLASDFIIYLQNFLSGNLQFRQYQYRERAGN